MKNIKLTQGKYALVDDEDFDKLSKFKWQAIYRCKNKNKFYAYRKDQTKGQNKNIKMHRVIMGLNDPKIHIDHINGDALDNRKINLRICSSSENNTNRPKDKDNTTGYKGVRKPKKSKKFYASITKNNVVYKLGSFITAIEAARAYNKKAIELHGEFAWLNNL